MSGTSVGLLSSFGFWAQLNARGTQLLYIEALTIVVITESSSHTPSYRSIMGTSQDLVAGFIRWLQDPHFISWRTSKPFQWYSYRCNINVLGYIMHLVRLEATRDALHLMRKKSKTSVILLGDTVWERDGDPFYQTGVSSSFPNSIFYEFVFK